MALESYALLRSVSSSPQLLVVLCTVVSGPPPHMQPLIEHMANSKTAGRKFRVMGCPLLFSSRIGCRSSSRHILRRITAKLQREISRPLGKTWERAHQPSPPSRDLSQLLLEASERLAPPRRCGSQPARDQTRLIDLTRPQRRSAAYAVPGG